MPWSISLASPAPSGGTVISLSTSDPSIVSVIPANIYMPEGSTTPRTVPQLNSVNFGKATITASAYGLPTVTDQVQVTAFLQFSTGSVTIHGTGSQSISLNLSAPGLYQCRDSRDGRGPRDGNDHGQRSA